MKKSHYYAITTICLTSLFMMPVTFFGFIFGMGWMDSYIGSVLFYVTIVGFFLSVCTFAGLLIIGPKTKVGQVYMEEYSRWMYERTERQRLQSLKDFDPTHLPPYHGKRIFTFEKLGLTIIVFAMMSVPIFLAIRGLVYSLVDSRSKVYTDSNYIFILVFVAIVLVVVCFFIKNYGLRRVVFDDEGVHFIKFKKIIKSYQWSEIKTIGISTGSEGMNTKFSYLYIATNEIEGSVFFLYPDAEDEMIVLSYRPKVLHCIFQYWQGKVVNLDKQKSWLRYIKRLGVASQNP